MRIQLYINGKMADLGSAGESLILWTYTREDAESPAAVKNAFTKTVTLPGTEANHQIFAHIYRTDHVSTFADFDPLERIPFTCLGDDGDILESGYLKLDRVLRAGSLVISYEVTLYGGLGNFIYELTYKADGTKKTLADLRWPRAYNSNTAEDITLVEHPGVPIAWRSLEGEDWLWNYTGLLNFAPCQNGIPSDNFDADKGYYIPGFTTNTRYTGVEVPYTDEDTGDTWSPSSEDQDGGVLISLGNKLTEWEVQDLRESLQRPVFSIHRFLRALTFAENTGGWTFVLNNESFFDISSAFVGRGWITLPYPKQSYIYAFDEFRYLREYLSASDTPAAYLLGIAKTFGLVFSVDKTTRTVTLMSRDAYYATGNPVIDLDGRVDGSHVPELRPFLMDARFYDYQHPAAGAFAEDYKERYGRQYGSFRLDTSYGFDAADIDVMKAVPFKGCADAAERSAWYFVQTGGPDGLVTLKFYRFGECSYTLYNGEQSKKITVDPPGRPKKWFWPASQGAIPMPQMHDASGKPLDGAGVLLFFAGTMGLPSSAGGVPVVWHLSTRTHGMLTLNGGRECWNLSLAQDGTVYNITSIPSFRRWIEWPGRPGFQEPTHMMDFGDPQEVAFPGNPNGQGIFVRRWERYMSDRYNRDTMVLTAWVNLAGLRVDASLLRRFFWFDGAYWSLNKIIDFNPAGVEPTKCEFVKVQDRQNYTNGQTF